MENAARKIDLNVDAVKGAILEQLDDSKRQQLMDWACPEDTGSEESYEAALRLKQPMTGKWFLESHVFRQWLETKNTLLWLHGIRELFHTVALPLMVTNTYFSWVRQDSSLVGSPRAELQSSLLNRLHKCYDY